MSRNATLPQYEAAAALELFLGDPEDDSVSFNYRNAVALDEREEYPAVACALLDQWGLHLYYVPESEGGRLRSFEEALALGRIVSRRDLSVMIEHSISFLGYTFVWIGSSESGRRAAAGVIQQRGRIALGLTEREHGGDLVHCEVRAERDGEVYRLSGEKWLINNGTRGAAVSLLARTDPRGGPRGCSFFFVEKAALPANTHQPLPKIPTHGIRGVDISGLSFRDAPVDASSIIGREGAGLEIALKGLQVTRTMCANLSLGAADTALRVTLDFALRRRIAGSTVFEIPAAQAALCDAFIDLLISDCVSTAGARALHVTPAQMSVHSAVVKYFVPVTCERMVHSLATVLGARHFVREEHWHGLFQKILRDIAIVVLFDGSTAVNLNIISSQLPALCVSEQPGGDATASLRAIFALGHPLPPFEPARLSLFNDGRDDITQAVPMLRDRIRFARDASSDVLQALDAQLGGLEVEYDLLCRTVSSDPAAAKRSRGQTAEMFALAGRYCAIGAASACVHFWLESRHELDEFFAAGEWLVLALHRLRAQLRTSWEIEAPPFRDRVAAEMRRRFEQKMLFSIVPLQLADAAKAAAAS